MRIKTTPIAIFAVAVAIALSGCSDQAPSRQKAVVRDAVDVVKIDDVWVKAADSGMTAAFAELKNTGTDIVTLVSAATPASKSVRLHETTLNEAGDSVMHEKFGGFVIDPGGSLELEPGENHLMLMDLVSPLKAGDNVEFTLTFSDESTLKFVAPVKDFSGANENYEDSELEMDSVD